MGAALRHGATYLAAAQRADRRLLLVLTDGGPRTWMPRTTGCSWRTPGAPCWNWTGRASIPIASAWTARRGTHVHDIFGGGNSVVDRVERLPERLPMPFLSLTR